MKRRSTVGGLRIRHRWTPRLRFVSGLWRPKGCRPCEWATTSSDGYVNLSVICCALSFRPSGVMEPFACSEQQHGAHVRAFIGNMPDRRVGCIHPCIHLVFSSRLVLFYSVLFCRAGTSSIPCLRNDSTLLLTLFPFSLVFFFTCSTRIGREIGFPSLSRVSSPLAHPRITALVSSTKNTNQNALFPPFIYALFPLSKILNATNNSKK